MKKMSTRTEKMKLPKMNYTDKTNKATKEKSEKLESHKTSCEKKSKKY